MPQCHKCPHDGHPTDACIECARREERREAFGSDLSDERAASLDALAESGIDPAAWQPSPEALADADEREGQAECAAGLDPGLLLDFLCQFLSLSPREMFVVGSRFRALRHPRGTPTTTGIARALGTSKQEVKDIMCACVAKCPSIAAIFAGVSMNFRPPQRRAIKKGGASRSAQSRGLRLDRRDLYRQTKMDL